MRLVMKIMILKFGLGWTIERNRIKRLVELLVKVFNSRYSMSMEIGFQDKSTEFM